MRNRWDLAAAWERVGLENAVGACPRPEVILDRPGGGCLCNRGKHHGHTIEWADLAREQFDPVLREADEPDWADPAKIYSEEVQREMRRIERNDATVMIFPVFWWSMPALLKGWIDRVWNNGWAYGERKFPQKRVWMIGVAGSTAEAYAGRGYDSAIQTQMNAGILDYCGIQDRRLHLLYGSIEGPTYPEQILSEALALGRAF
jgi:NAD(P)H dehydrogenase (quinone)